MPGLPEYKAIEVQKVPEDKSVRIATFVEQDLRRPNTIRQLEFDLLALPEHMAQKRSQRLLIDFTGVTHVPSAVFGIVLQVCRECENAGIMVRLCCLHPTVAKAFNLLNASGLVSVFGKKRHAIMTPWAQETKGKPRRWWWPF